MNTVLYHYYFRLNILQLVFCVFLIFSLGFSQKNTISFNRDVPYNDPNLTHWADSMLNTLSLEHKIGQLFMVTASGKGLSETYYQQLDSLIMNYQIGGVLFLKSHPDNLRRLLSRFNKKSSIPLLASIDAEWGLGMRLDSTQSFPWMMTLGAIQNDNLIYDFGVEVARQLKELGVHINFAPVVDVNNNPNNPIIDRRSFSSDPDLVSSKALAYMLGLQDNHILACAKHFPGHGDTDVDSHKSLPILYHDKIRLDSIELPPFQELIRQGVGAVMMAHMNLPLIDTLEIPSSFSHQIINDILKTEMNFKGLVISDALNMQALSEYGYPGEIELNAFLAGNDILLCPDNLFEAINLIKNKINQNPFLTDQLNQSCRKILMLKKWSGAFANKNKRDLNLTTHSSILLNRDLSKNAITVLSNNDSILPLDNLDMLNIAYVSMGSGDGNPFFNRLNNYIPIDKYTYSASLVKQNNLLEDLKKYDLVVVGLHYPNNNFWEKHSMNKKESIFLSRLSIQNQTIINLFGHPKILNSLDVKNISALVLAYQNTLVIQDLAAQLNFGSIPAYGRLPIKTNHFNVGDGIDVNVIRDFGFSLPIELGFDEDSLVYIDSIINNAINDKIIPGCQIVASRYGRIFYNRSFGFHTYDSLEKVKDSDLYDIASVTKIASAAPILMNLVDQQSIKLNKKLKNYYSFPKNTDLQNLKLIDVLTHQSRLFPWIPFWTYFKDENNRLSSSVFSTTRSKDYSIQVADSLFFNSNYRDTIQKIIYSQPLLDNKEYKYSDLGFYVIHPILENLIREPIDNYLFSKIYKPIEALRITYNPRSKFLLSSIVPTENDTYFRNQLIHGYVHDQGASLFGGIALHAGLFSNAIDLMKLMQLYLDDGNYLGQSILPEKEIKYFTSSHFEHSDNRRGVVFDKPSIDPDEEGPTCDSISAESFGHSGWTGTLAWADPSTEIVYIFLSNGRAYPNENSKLLQSNIRTNIQEIIYKSIIY
mgnify:CR=1 FL=1|tara:strand:+ start:8783 stop:11740 length:2958 start_codon:yes stop_codon:yes gene_type:complete